MTKLQTRKQFIVDFFERLASERKNWVHQNSEFYANDITYMRFLVPPGQKILELGCGNGHLLSALSPKEGVGVDFSPNMVKSACDEYPDLTFTVGDMESNKFIESLEGPFDFIILSDSIGMLEDIEATLSNLHKICSPDTRIIIAYYSQIWNPILKIGEYLKLKMPQIEQNWLGLFDIERLLGLSNFEVVRREWRQLIPLRCLG